MFDLIPMEIRQSQIVLISKRAEKANDKINEILNALGWTRDELKQWHKERLNKFKTCPLNQAHIVPEKTFKEHYRYCLLKQRGIIAKKKTTTSNVKSSLYFYKKSPHVISFIEKAAVPLDPDYQNRIEIISDVVNEEDDYVKDIVSSTTTEKCQAYDQVIQRSNQLRRHHQFYSNIDQVVYDKIKQEKKQLHQQQRKNKHRIKMTKKSAVETQKELIDAYMQEYRRMT